jgi:hypothetical protein
MKKLIQNSGVRKWYGDEWIAIQDEANAVIEGHLGASGMQFISSGVTVDGTDVSSGLVGLIHADGFKICRLTAATGLTFPCYLKVTKTEETRLYLDGATKAVSATYAAEISATNEGGYLELKADNSTPRYTDVLQDAAHRFCSDSEKTSYAGQGAAAITALRDGVADACNTLKKLKEYTENLYPDPVDIDALKLELRGNVDEALNTMEEIVGYIDGLTYLPTFEGTSDLANATIDWTGTPERTKTLTADTAIDASNLIVGKTIGLKVTGNFNLTFSAKFTKVTGSPNPTAGATNYIQMKCLNDTVGSASIIYLVFYLP